MKLNATILSTLLAVVTMAALPSLSHADRDHRAGIDGRESNQRSRIVRGYRNDGLTRKEAARLAAQQARIRAFEYRNRKDGRGYTAAERAATQRRLNAASRDIRRQRHDRQTRG